MPKRTRRVPPAGQALAVATTALVFAALAIVAGRAGPLTAHSPAVATGPPQPVTGAALPAESFPVPPARPPAGWSGAWLWWIGVTLSALIAVAILWWLVVVALRRRRRVRPVAAPGSAGQVIGTMLGALSEPAAADLGEARTFVAERAADDIIASWEIVENAAAAFGFRRRPAATPTEFLQEMVAEAGDGVIPPEWLGHLADPGLADAGLAAPGRTAASNVLLHLYHRARFDVVALTPGAATLARAAARGLIESWDLPHRRLAGEVAGAVARGRHR